jgi:D-3-phosphoglycerate dehydrogenase
MAERPIIVMTTTMNEAGTRLLREAGEVRMAPPTDRPALLAAVADADALVVRTSGVYDAEVMDAAPRLKVIGRHGVGYDHVDIPAATARGILVVTTPGANTESVAEHALAMMIGLSKHFPQQGRALVEGRFHDRTAHSGRDILGRTLGIIGYGRIGKRVGEIAHRAFGIKVLYHDILPMSPEDEARANARRASFEEVLAESEYVTLHVPLDASTRRLIDRRALALMRPDAILLNTCRGPVVDEAAVAEALDAGKLYGYGADVFDIEPPPEDHPLVWRTDNVMLTPHSAAQTGESLVNMARGVAEDVVRVLRGEMPENPVEDAAVVLANRRALGKP